MTDLETPTQGFNRHSRAGYAMTHGSVSLDDYESVQLRAYQQGQRAMLNKAIAAVEAIHSPVRIDDDLSYCRGCFDAAYEQYSFEWPCAVVTAVHALREKP